MRHLSFCCRFSLLLGTPRLNRYFSSLFRTIFLAAFMQVFQKDLYGVFASQRGAERFSPGSSEKKTLVIMACIILLWLTEPVHSLDAAKVAAIGAAAMFLQRIIGLKDLKTINLSLMLFLTAAFSIGRVLLFSGVAEKIKAQLLLVLPAADSIWFLPAATSMRSGSGYALPQSPGFPSYLSISPGGESWVCCDSDKIFFCSNLSADIQ